MRRRRTRSFVAQHPFDAHFESVERAHEADIPVAAETAPVDDVTAVRDVETVHGDGAPVLWTAL